MYIITSGLNPNEKHIEHHGILGMKWGIRRYQNRDGSLTELGYQRFKEKFKDQENVKWRTMNKEKAGLKIGDKDYDTLPKGTTIRRASASDSERMSGSKYTYITGEDAYHYHESLSNGLLGYGSKGTTSGYEYEYKAKKDLKIANAKTVNEYLYSKYGNERIKDLMDKYGDLQIGEGNDISYEYLQKGITKGEKALYDALNGYKGELPSFKKQYMTNNSEHISQEVVNGLKKLGYDGMCDIEDYGHYEYPMVIFDAEKNFESQKVKKLY